MEKVVGKLYSSSGTVVLCTGMGASEKRFSGVVVKKLDPTSDFNVGDYSDTWTWVELSGSGWVFVEYVGEVLLDNKKWKKPIIMGDSPG